MGLYSVPFLMPSLSHGFHSSWLLSSAAAKLTSSDYWCLVCTSLIHVISLILTLKFWDKHYHPFFINRENTMFPKSRHQAQIRVPDLHGYQTSPSIPELYLSTPTPRSQKLNGSSSSLFCPGFLVSVKITILLPLRCQKPRNHPGHPSPFYIYLLYPICPQVLAEWSKSGHLYFLVKELCIPVPPEHWLFSRRAPKVLAF